MTEGFEGQLRSVWALNCPLVGPRSLSTSVALVQLLALFGKIHNIAQLFPNCSIHT